MYIIDNKDQIATPVLGPDGDAVQPQRLHRGRHELVRAGEHEGQEDVRQRFVGGKSLE